jgi:hypothetical protein
MPDGPDGGLARDGSGNDVRHLPEFAAKEFLTLVLSPCIIRSFPDSA